MKRKMDRIEKIITTMFVLTIGLLIVFIIACINIGMRKQLCDTCDLEFDVDGYYDMYDKYYCIWTKGRYYKSVIDTENHEICHHLINEDYKHFCNNQTKIAYNNNKMLGGYNG